MRMRTIRVKRKAYRKLVRCYKKHARGHRSAEWDAIFSCNLYKEAWPCDYFGYLHPVDRVNVQKRYKLLRKLVKIVLADRPEGGRFFLNEDGVFVNPEWQGLYPIAYFDWNEK